MANNIPGVVYQMIRYKDGSRKIPYISAAVQELFGYSPDEVYADANILIEAIHQDERVEKEVIAQRAMSELSKFDWSGRIVRRDGEIRWIRALCETKKLDDGAYHWDGVMLDVTHEKLAELDHVATKERLAWLLKSSPVVIYACEAKSPHPLTYLSDNAEELLGVNLDEYRSDPFYWQNRIHPEDRLANQSLLEGIESSRGGTIEYRFRASRNQYRWIRDEMRLVSRDGTDEIVGTVVDVTERRQAQDALRESEERFRAMTGASPVGVFVADKAGKLVYANSKLAEILKVSEVELLGDTVYRLVHPEDAERVSERLEEALKRDQEASVQCRFQLRDYTTIWCTIKTAPLAGAGAVGTVEDVTERHELELETEQARIEAERANQAKSAFLSRLSHELRTPLHAVLGFAQLLQVSKLDDNQRESADQVVSSGKHLLSLINDVLDIARAESGELSVQIEPVELLPIVNEAVRMLSIQARDKGVLIDVKLRENENLVVQADRKRLLQVAINVLSNAIKYNKREGAIIVSTEKSGNDRMTLVVRDTGTGISQDKVARLFTPFDRLGAETSEVEGSGLGLILSKRLVEAMRGSIRIDSDVRTGTVARLTLPVSSSAPTGYAAVRIPDLARTETKPLNVLLIEDNESNVRLFESVFQARPMYGLTVRRTGKSGFEAAVESLPDLVMLDAHLPDVVGTSLLDSLRREPGLRDTPIIVVSAEADEKTRSRFVRSGASAFLTKPLDIDVLIRTIDQVREGARL